MQWKYLIHSSKSLTSEILTVAQLYRDRADMENNLDKLKNQWGWFGYVTQDLLRCQIAARKNRPIDFVSIVRTPAPYP